MANRDRQVLIIFKKLNDILFFKWLHLVLVLIWMTVGFAIIESKVSNLRPIAKELIPPPVTKYTK